MDRASERHCLTLFSWKILIIQRKFRKWKKQDTRRRLLNYCKSFYFGANPMLSLSFVLFKDNYIFHSFSLEENKHFQFVWRIKMVMQMLWGIRYTVKHFRIQFFNLNFSFSCATSFLSSGKIFMQSVYVANAKRIPNTVNGKGRTGSVIPSKCCLYYKWRWK